MIGHSKKARSIPAVPPGQKCTWEGCLCNATYSQISKAGKYWAFLCLSHHMALGMAVKSGGNRQLLSAWVKAQGGSQKAATRFVESEAVKAGVDAVAQSISEPAAIDVPGVEL